MILTALVLLAVLGFVATFGRNLPERDERWEDLSRRRRVLSAAALPVGAVALLVGSALAVARADDVDSAFALLTLIVFVGLAVGGLAVVGMAAVRLGRLWRLRRPRPGS